MSIETVTKLVYGLFGGAFLIVGVSVLAFGTGLLPDAASRAIMNAAHGDTNALHIIQEFGSFLVFIGLITFWFIRRYEQSKPFHWAMTVAWGLIAFAHWFDARGSVHSGIGAMINSLPFVLFLLLGVLRRSVERSGR